MRKFLKFKWYLTNLYLISLIICFVKCSDSDTTIDNNNDKSIVKGRSIINDKLLNENITIINSSNNNNSINRNNNDSYNYYKLIYKKNKIISKYEFELFQENLHKIKRFQCRKDLNFTIWNLLNGEKWAIAMYDSSAKSPTGIEIGSVYQLGNFDECINGNAESDISLQYFQSIVRKPIKPKVKAKYCLLDVEAEHYTVRSKASRKAQVQNLTTIYWAVCVPASCHARDIEIFVGNVIDRKVYLKDDKCYELKPFEVTNGMVIYGSIVLFFVMMVICSTIYQCHTIYSLKGEKNHEDDSDFVMFVKSFSIIENLKKLFQKSNDQLGLNAINGIKALSMVIIISGHTLIFIISGPQHSLEFEAKEVKRIQNAFLFNSILFVDAFLVLSGFLFCRILLRELEQRKGNVNPFLLYIFRYIRLTPAYFAVIAFYMTWFPVIGSGPLWNHKIGMEQKRCEISWWLNLLYINNYFGTENLCMFQSWYLSADTQLFIVAPIFIFALYKNRRLGIWLLTMLTIITTILPAALTYYKEWDPTFLVFEDENHDISSNPYFLSSYIKTHMRATGYVFGLITGFILHIIIEKGIKMSRTTILLLWTNSAIIGASSMLTVVSFYSDINFTPIQSAIYAGLHRLGWSLSISWLIIASCTGNAGFLNKILTSRCFAPLSRLTYCAYLTNGMVELYALGSTRAPVYMSHINLFGIVISHQAYTLVTAVILCLLFESPIHGIERILLRKEKQRREIVQTVPENAHSSSTSSDESI